MSDSVNSPKHYVQAGEMLEPIDVIHAGPFDLCNTIKYLSRAGHKDDELQDVKKAKYYFDLTAKSHLQDPHPYEYWLKRNALLLRKLKPFKSFKQYTVEGLLCELEHVIENKFRDLSDK